MTKEQAARLLDYIDRQGHWDPELAALLAPLREYAKPIRLLSPIEMADMVTRN